MPNRDIKESCRSSETLAMLSHGGERLFWRLTTLADDFGRFDARPAVVRAECYKVMLDKVRTSDVDRWLGELAAARLVSLYTVGGKPYGQFVTWARHQRQRASNSKWPSPASADRCQPPPANALEETEETETTETTERGGTDERGQAPPLIVPSSPLGSNGWTIPEPIVRALDRSSRLGRVRRLREDAAWWRAEIRANRELDLAVQVARAEAWLETHRQKAARKKDLVAFLHDWFKNEDIPQ